MIIASEADVKQVLFSIQGGAEPSDDISSRFSCGSTTPRHEYAVYIVRLGE